MPRTDSVVQDPTLPSGNVMMLYEAENHCPGGVNQQPFYATVVRKILGQRQDWPAPANGPWEMPHAIRS